MLNTRYGEYIVMGKRTLVSDGYEKNPINAMKDDDSPQRIVVTPLGSSVSGGGTDQSVTTPPTPQ